MRRILAIALLIAFGSPTFASLAAPLFAANTDPEAALPACCRSHGAHHCAMRHSVAAPTPTGPAFTTPPCPLYPTASTPLRLATASLNTPLRLAVEQLRTPAPLATTPRPARTFTASANLNRGPPARLA